MEQLDLAYLAGLFDGEGSFSIQIQVRQYKGRKSVNFGPKMNMTLTHGAAVLDDLRATFGGTVYRYAVDDRGFSESRWSLSRREPLIVAASALLPYLRIKRDTCERFLQALSLFPISRADHLAGERTWTLESVLAVAEIATTLNPHSARRAKYGPEVLRTLDLIYT